MAFAQDPSISKDKALLIRRNNGFPRENITRATSPPTEISQWVAEARPFRCNPWANLDTRAVLPPTLPLRKDPSIKAFGTRKGKQIRHSSQNGNPQSTTLKSEACASSIIFHSIFASSQALNVRRLRKEVKADPRFSVMSKMTEA